MDQFAGIRRVAGRKLKVTRALLGGLVAAMMVACSPRLVNLTVSSDGYTHLRDISYGEATRNKLDIYVPDDLGASAPSLLFFYGGNWQSGSKDYYKALGQSLATAGVIVAIADYRLYPEILYPDFLYDSAAAFRLFHDNIGSYGGDPNRVFLAGHSAGAYNAVMLASDPSYLRAEGLEPSSVNGVIGVAGPYDFLPLTDPALITMFGGAQLPQTQPIRAIDGRRPPMLLITGTEDKTVLPRNAERMAARLREFDSPVEVISYDGEGHLGIILSMVWPFKGRNDLREDILDFVHAR
jgi:acetyl esterase/lipase